MQYMYYIGLCTYIYSWRSNTHIVARKLNYLGVANGNFATDERCLHK